MLEKIRVHAGFPFKINSGFRTQAHNSLVAKVEKSAHTSGLAADIGIVSGNQGYKIIDSAIKHGITRIGIAKTFIHVDMDLSKPQNVIWLYS